MWRHFTLSIIIIIIIIYANESADSRLEEAANTSRSNRRMFDARMMIADVNTVRPMSHAPLSRATRVPRQSCPCDMARTSLNLSTVPKLFFRIHRWSVLCSSVAEHELRDKVAPQSCTCDIGLRVTYTTVNSRDGRKRKRCTKAWCWRWRLHGVIIHSLRFRRCALRVDGNDLTTTSSDEQDALHAFRQHVEELYVCRAPAKDRTTQTSQQRPHATARIHSIQLLRRHLISECTQIGWTYIVLFDKFHPYSTAMKICSWKRNWKQKLRRTNS